MLLHATGVEPAGRWPHGERRGTATLSYDDRHRRRLRLATDAGEAFLLDLPEATLLRQGDGLSLAGGGWIEVRAAPERLLEVTAPGAEPLLLARIIWHLGNRHLPAQIEEGRVLIRPDHVIAEMVRGLGGEAREVEAPFTPEGGAYARGHDHAHHGGAHVHTHEHAHHDGAHTHTHIYEHAHHDGAHVHDGHRHG